MTKKEAFKYYVSEGDKWDRIANNPTINDNVRSNAIINRDWAYSIAQANIFN